MSARLVYLKLELERAYKRLPHIIAGAVVLLLLAGTVTLLISKMLYRKQVSGRITVGVVLPEGDAVAKKTITMVSSLESVKSVCDFEYMDREEGVVRLRAEKLFRVVEMSEGLIQDVMSGTNTPVRIILPEGVNLRNRIFKKLTDTGSRTLGASQAGIYADDELCIPERATDSIPRLEADLNRISIGYNLPRTDYFRNVRVTATGDVDTYHFYGISAFMLFLLLCAILVSAYLSPANRTMRQKLSLIGVGNATVIGARILGPGLLMGVTALLALTAAWGLGWIMWNLPGILSVAAICMAASSMVVFLYQVAGSLMEGMMLLFLVVTAMHSLIGGFLPLIFLPASLRTAVAFLSTYIFMEGVKMAVTPAFSVTAFRKLVTVAAVCFLLSLWVEVGRR